MVTAGPADWQRALKRCLLLHLLSRTWRRRRVKHRVCQLLWELYVKIAIDQTNKKAVVFTRADNSVFSVKPLTARQHLQMFGVFMQIAVLLRLKLLLLRVSHSAPSSWRQCLWRVAGNAWHSLHTCLSSGDGHNVHKCLQSQSAGGRGTADGKRNQRFIYDSFIIS